jgi:hypothetical protein
MEVLQVEYGTTTSRVLMAKHVGQGPLGRSKSRWEDNIKHILKKQDGKACTGFIWLRIKISGWFL